MTDSTRNATPLGNTPEGLEGSTSPNDRGLDARVRMAYGQMDPGQDALDRMKSAVLAAQEAATPEPGAGSTGANSPDAGYTGGDDVPPARANVHPLPRRKRGAWKWAIPAAACLIVGAVAFGVAGTGTSTNPDVVQVPYQSSPQAAPGDSAKNGMSADSAVGYYEAGETEDAMEPLPPTDFNTEEYASVDETGFISTKANPLSTVSADVDTASYCNLRRLLKQGETASDIPTGAVRIEEMLNYFHYDYATPTGNDLFATTVQAGTCPWNDQTKLLVMGFSTAPEDAAASKGSNLVFLIDVSGSMDSPDKLQLLQDSFATLLDGLDGDDRVSVVTYSGEEEVVLEGAPGGDDRSILRAIYQLRAEGSTNGEAGLKMAYEVAERNRIDGGVNRIIMASDGDLNVGMTSESDLHDFVDGKRETGIYLSVLGFGGGNYKDTKMETLADHGNGQYHYIDCIEEAERVFGENLTANLVPLADDVKIQVEFNPAQVKGYRLIGYENRELADEDFRNDARDAGDVGPSSQFTVAYEVVLSDSGYPVAEPDLKYGGQAEGDVSNTDWLTCSMRYKPVGSDEAREQQTSVGAGVLAEHPSDDWRFAAAAIEFGMVLRNSGYAGSASLDEALKLAGESNPDEERRGLVELMELARDN